MAATKPIPDGFSSVTPYLVIDGVAKAIDFYTRAFGAVERFRLPAQDGKRCMHAELQIGNAVVMLSDYFPEMGMDKPQVKGGTGLHLYVPDVDAAYAKAVAAGAVSVMAPWDAFWGDRYCKVTDPFGFGWSIATHTRDLTPEQIAEGAKAAMSGG